MPKITDQDYHTACSNGDGTFSLVKAAQWLCEAMTGKTLSEEEAREWVEEGKRRALARKEARVG